MRLSYSLGSLLSINEVIECSKILNKHKVDTVWIPETWGMEAFSMLTIVSQNIQNSHIGSSIINTYSRSPALISMGAVTLDTISKGRLILGLGTSSKPIVEDFHGYDFNKPLSRIREYVEIIQILTSGEKINYEGRFFNLKGFKLLIKPYRKKIPIYIAAVNDKMIELTSQIADGVIFYLRPINEIKNAIKKIQKFKKIDIACQIITSVSDDSDKAILRAKKTLAFYIAVGKIYREFLAKNGFKNETNNIYHEYKKNGLGSIHEFVTDSMINSLTICGTSDECITQLRRFNETGITLPILQFNPVGNVIESFNKLIKTFAKENE